MYEILIEKKVEKRLQEDGKARGDVKEKLKRRRENNKKAKGGHKVNGKLKDKWAGGLGENIRRIEVIESKIFFFKQKTAYELGQ